MKPLRGELARGMTGGPGRLGKGTHIAHKRASTGSGLAPGKKTQKKLVYENGARVGGVFTFPAEMTGSSKACQAKLARQSKPESKREAVLLTVQVK
jgi:hypothetical protein